MLGSYVQNVQSSFSARFPLIIQDSRAFTVIWGIASSTATQPRSATRQGTSDSDSGEAPTRRSTPGLELLRVEMKAK